MRLLVAVQVGLPLLLLAWLVLRPPASWGSLGAHGLALPAILAALHLSGIWTVVPWWLPMAIAALALALLAWLLRSRPPQRALPRRWEWLRVAVLLVALGVGGWQTVLAWQGRQQPRAPLIDLAWPLPPGQYLVINGGTNLAVSSHAETLDLSVPRHRLFQGQSLGLDIVAINAAGRTTQGLWPAEPRAYAIYGRPVLAPCSGSVLQAIDGIVDQAVPELGADARTGNGVLLRCAGADVLLAHFAPGSLRVRPGETVKVGQVLGAAGNSGASNEPHLHIHAQRPGTAEQPLAGAPLPMRLQGRWLARNDRVTIPPD